MALVVDAGPLVASIDADDTHHDVCARLFANHPGPLVVPALVVTEVVQLVASRVGVRAEVSFLADLADGNFSVEHVAARDWKRIAQLVGRYRDLRLGSVDASVIVAAERLNVTTVATLDRRHFGVVVPAHVPAFSMLP